eukprot:5348153-Amphidinium_carterae.1
MHDHDVHGRWRPPLRGCSSKDQSARRTHPQGVLRSVDGCGTLHLPPALGGRTESCSSQLASARRFFTLLSLRCSTH